MMRDDSLEMMVSMVEKAFLRLQAGDIVVTCLEKEDIGPVQRYVEDLVLAGPKSLSALREVRVEVSTRRSQFQGDIAEVFSHFEMKLGAYGVNLPSLTDRLLVKGMDTSGFLTFLHQHGIEESSQNACMNLIHNTKEAMYSLAKQILLLQEVELFLDDWIWGLIYQSARQVLVENHPAGFHPRYTQ